MFSVFRKNANICLFLNCYIISYTRMKYIIDMFALFIPCQLKIKLIMLFVNELKQNRRWERGGWIQPLSSVGFQSWHRTTVLTVRHTSPSSNDDVYKLVSTTVGNDVRSPCSATIGASRRAVGHPQRIIPSRYIERHCPN